MTILDQLPPGARVAVIRLRSLGDCVLTTPAVRILKDARRDLSVALVVEDRFGGIFAANPDVDAILPPSIHGVRDWKPSLCLNLHGGSRSARLTALSGARFRAGFEHFLWQRLYNVRIPKAQRILAVDRTVHTAEHLASAMFYLGAPRTEIPRAVLYASHDPVSVLPVLHPFASDPSKTWPAEYFVELANELGGALFIGGAEDDFTPFRAFPILRGAALGELASRLAAAPLFIGNDSGPAHMAAALGIPVIVFFSSSDPAIWGPWRTTGEVLTASDLREISVSRALEAAARLRVAA